MRPRWKQACLALSILLATLLQAARAADTAATKSLLLPVVIDSPVNRQIQYALTQAYAGLHIDVKYSQRPPLRALVESNSGKLDGEIARARLIEADAPHLLRVDVPVYINSFGIWARKASGLGGATLDTIKAVKRVGIVRGISTSNDMTKGWNNVVRIDGYASAVRMLNQGMIDVLLGGDTSTIEGMSRSALDQAQFSYNEVHSLPLYHYLHQRHASLLPLVKAELERIKGKSRSVHEAVMASGAKDLPQ